MGTHRISTGNTDYRAEKHSQDFRQHRVVLCTLPLLFSAGVQRRDLHRVSGTSSAVLFSTKSISDPRQCLLPQRQRRLDLVLRQSETYRSIQSSSLLSGTQRHRENMASYTPTRHTQQIFPNSRRTSLIPNFNLSKHSEESISGYGISSSISVNLMSLYLYKDI